MYKIPISFMKLEDRRNSAGAVIVLVALSLFVLVAVVALAIDVALISAASEQGRQFARLGSLTAIEEYFAATSEGVGHEEALLRAKDRVNSVSEFNLLFSDRGGTAPYVKLASESDCPDGSDYCADLQAGRWVVEDEEQEGDDSCEGEYPCFTADLAGEVPNAFRISGQFHSSITTRLASIFLGADSIPTQVAATSSFVPRRGCFLIDISPTISYATHLGWWGGGPFNLDPPGSDLGEPPGDVTLDFTCIGDGSCGPNPFNGFGNRYAFFTRRDNPTEYLSYFPPMDLGWLALEQEFPEGESTETRHHADDYQVHFLLNDDDYDLEDEFDTFHPSPTQDLGRYAISSDRRWARVDTAGNPEPLTTFMNGINQALQGFKERQVSGDQACLIFFDSNITWPRVVNLTSDFDYLIEFTDFTNPGDIASDEDLFVQADRDDLARQRIIDDGVGETRLRSIRHHIMPLRASATDIRLGLEEALGQLQVARDQGPPASDFVVLITDGLQNCFGGDCANTYPQYARGMQEIFDTLQGTLEERRVPIHVIFEGPEVGPHSIDIYKGEKEPTEHPIGQVEDCYTDEEYRASGGISSYGFVEGQGFPVGQPGYDPQVDFEAIAAWEDMSADTPFYQANYDWYRISVITRGIWGPLRDRGPACDGYFVTHGNPEETQNPWLSPSHHRPFCEPSEDRQQFDRYCRPREQQMEDYLSRIVGENPYTVVEVR